MGGRELRVAAPPLSGGNAQEAEFAKFGLQSIFKIILNPE